MKTYKTETGDTWDLIAKRVFGRENLMHKLIEVNPDYRKVRFFKNGVILRVPDLDLDTFADDSAFPPWKRKK